LVAKTLGSLLHGRNHGRRTADEHLHVGRRSGAVFLCELDN
jgi:hypothetical protein